MLQSEYYAIIRNLFIIFADARVMSKENRVTDQEKPGKEAVAERVDFSVIRIILLTFPLLVLSGVWIEFTEIHRQAGEISNGVPPAAAYAIFLPLLLLCAFIPWLRRRWKYTRGELIVIFSMLVLAVPIYGSGFWRHFVALQHENHRSRYLDLAMAGSPLLWPNHGNLLQEASVEDPPVEYAEWKLSHPDRSQIGPTPDPSERCLRITHENEGDESSATLLLRRSPSDSFVNALERYALFARVRLDDTSGSPLVSLSAGVRPDRMREIKSLRRDTPVGVLSPDRFVITGGIDVLVPRELDDTFFIRIMFRGKGTLYARDFSLIDTEVVYRYLEGYKEADPNVYANLSKADRSDTRLRPPRGLNKAYIKHVLFGLVPWDAWIRPLAMWSLIVVGVFLAMFCLITLFYRHWEEGDRLTFPLQNFLLDITRLDDGQRLALLRSAPFWIAFAFCAVHLSLQELQTYYEEIPAASLELVLADLLPPGLLKDALQPDWIHPSLTFSVRPLYVAVAFFMSLEISMSLVVFFLLSWVLRFVGYFTPLKALRLSPDYLSTPYPFGLQMAAGGLLFMAFFCILSARKHIRKVSRKVFLGDNTIDDSREAVRYRVAAFGLLVALTMFLLFARMAQINMFFVVALLGVYLLLALSAARIRAETGLPDAGILIMYPHRILIGFGGVVAYGYGEWLFTGQTLFLAVGVFLLSAPLIAEAMAAATRVGVPLKKLSICLFAAFFISLPVGGVISMSSGYTYGAMNMNKDAAHKRHTFGWNVSGGVEADNAVIERYFNQHPNEEPVITAENRSKISIVQTPVLVVTGLSFLTTGLLALARVIWLGFPLHPLGFALAFTPAMSTLWGSIAVGWLMKSLGLRFGGLQFSRGIVRPFCVGLFVGDIAVTSFWVVIETFSRNSALA